MATAPLNGPVGDITNDPRAVCVYCASSPGRDPAYRQAAVSLGEAIARANRTLIYGGGDRGLMGAVSAAVISSNGKAIGVLPSAMVKAGGEGRGEPEKYCSRVEAVNEGNMRSIVVDSMHERKTRMAQLAGGGFIALPGGYGTFEEVMEAITWSQIGMNIKPVIFVNVNGFYDPLRALVEGAIGQDFIQETNRGLVRFVDSPAGGASEGFDWGTATLEALESWKAPANGGLFEWGQEPLRAS